MGERDVVVTGGSPWGMRLTGGKDFGSPLMVSKVTPGSKSACAGVQDNDYVLRINGQDTKEMMHMDAQNCIKRSGDMLRLVLTQAKPKWAGVEITGTVSPTSSLAPARPTPPTSSLASARPTPPTSSLAPARPTPPTSSLAPARPTPPTSSQGPAKPTPPPAPRSAQAPPITPPSGVTFRTTPPNPPPQPSPPTVTYHGGLKPAGYDPGKLVEYTPTPVGEAGLDSSQSKQSPAYNRILMADEVPFGHASAEKGLERRIPTQPPPPPPAPTTPLTRQLQNIRIEQGNVVKTSERPAGYYPPPPPGIAPRPVPVSPKSIDTSSLPKPTPPPAASAPPPSPTRMPKDGVDAGRTPPSPGGATAKLSTRQGDCEKCNQPIRGPYAAALGRFWHPEHFTCTKCHKQLSNQTFVVEGDEPYCEPCYERSVAPMCEECKHTITGAYVCAVNRFWHKEHFKCFRCKRILGTDEGFNYEGGHLYCTACYSAEFGVVCAGCNKVIGGADLWVEALDKNWHPYCFVCESCKAPLEGGTFFVKMGHPYCGRHPNCGRHR